MPAIVPLVLTFTFSFLGERDYAYPSSLAGDALCQLKFQYSVGNTHYRRARELAVGVRQLVFGAAIENRVFPPVVQQTR